jgi:hypothetical protein
LSAVIISIVVLSIGINWLSTELGPFGDYEYAGTVDYYVDNDLFLTSLSLEVINFRSINISIVPDLDYYFYAEIVVFAVGVFTEEDVDTFDETINGAELSLFFEQEGLGAHFKRLKYMYELQISISSILETKLDIKCGFGDNDNGDLLFSANSANIESIWLQSSSGNVKAEFLNSTFVGDYGPFLIDSTYGNVAAHFVNTIFIVDETHLVLGGVKSELFVNQETYNEEASNYVFFHEVYGEIINLTYHISSEIGIGFLTPGLGDIHLSGLPSSITFPYYSDNYELASRQYLFRLYCRNGTVYINSI